jgi:hypothetical protein
MGFVSPGRYTYARIDFRGEKVAYTISDFVSLQCEGKNPILSEANVRVSGEVVTVVLKAKQPEDESLVNSLNGTYTLEGDGPAVKQPSP